MKVTQAAAAIFKIPTESPQPGRGQAPRRPAGQPKKRGRPAATGRVVASETRKATRGDGEVIELGLGITVYPPREKGGRWRAVWLENGVRKQCESVSEEKLDSRLDKVKERLSADAPHMTRPGKDLRTGRSACRRRPWCSPWRVSPRTSRTGMPMP